MVDVVTTELWLVRHGETDWSAAGRFCGRSDPALSGRGRAQASALRPLLENAVFDSFLSSPSRRALQTARLAYGEPRIEERLQELDFGDLEGCSWTECSVGMQARLLDYDTFEAPNGESVAELSKRVLGVVEVLGTGRHLLVTHGGVIRLLRGRVGNTEYPAPGSLSRIELEPAT